jgi:SAM-dependent methyltransferase
MSSTSRCPICGASGQRSPVEQGDDYIIYCCLRCDGDYAETPLSVDYRQEYQTGELSLIRLADPEEELREARYFAHYTEALKLMKKLPKKGKLLNITRGSTVFSKLAEVAGFEVYTLTSIPEATAYGKERFGLKKVVAGTITEAPPQWCNFDVVTCFEALEHLREPQQMLREIYSCLAPGGYFIVSAPNRNRLSVKLGRRDEHDYPPNHMTRWSKDVLIYFLNNIGFGNVTAKVGGVERRDLTAILLTDRINTKIVERKIAGLENTTEPREEFFLHSPVWGCVQKAGDLVASAMRATIGKYYGTFLIGFAQKPADNVIDSKNT